jgi:Bifunctional DNA primase/polymerase, N-terminal
MNWYIFPIKAGAKYPALVKWKTESSNELAVYTRWRKQFPGCNWGLDCGRTGLAVLDIDVKNGAVGRQSLEELITKHSPLPETLMQRTGSGGDHYIFKGVMGSTVNKVGVNIDTRGVGGMVLIPPSVVGGNPYKWLNELPTAPLPEWVAQLAAVPKTGTLQGFDAGPPQVFAALDPKESLAEGIERAPMPPLAWEPLVAKDGCPFIRQALETGGKDYTQPMWNLSTLCATFLEDGHALAHKMGKGHPGYSRETTETLYERKGRERRDKGLGWPSCAAIQSAGSRACGTCPHLAKGKSPLNLTRPISIAGSPQSSEGSTSVDVSIAAQGQPAGFGLDNRRHAGKLAYVREKANG